MARKKGKAFTLESNADKISAKISEAPEKVLHIVGKNLVKEIRSTTLKSQYGQRYKILSRTLGSWARKREKDLQIGFKMSIRSNAQGSGPGIVGGIMSGQEADPIKPVVIKNKDIIVQAIAQALNEIGRK